VSEFVAGVCAMTACVFGASAAAKIRSRAAYRAYRAGLGAIHLMPGYLLTTAAAVLAVGEALTAAWLTGCTALLAAQGDHASALLAESALATATLLTATLTVGITVAIRRGSPAPCPCFGVRSPRPTGPAHLLRNLVLLSAVVSGLTLGPTVRQPPTPAGLTLALGTAVVAAMLIIRWEDIAEVITPASARRRPQEAGKEKAGAR
jgi:hypothetical protein